MPYRFVPFRRLAVLLAAACIAFPAHSEPDAKKTETSTATYDVADLLHNPGVRSGFDSIEKVISTITLTVHPGCWGKDKKDNSTIAEFNSTQLQIHTTKANHEAIKSLLDAFRRMHDVAVDVRTQLCEIDRDSFDKLIRPRFGKGFTPGQPLPLSFDDVLLGQIRKKGSLLKKHSVRVGNRQKGDVFSFRQAFTYQAGLTPRNKFATGFTGVTVRASVTVTPDRRFVNLTLTQKTAEKKGIPKKTVRDPETGNAGSVEVPRMFEVSTTATVDVGDGVDVLLPLAYQPASLKSKDRVLLLLVQPHIFIEEEEKERARARKAG